MEKLRNLLFVFLIMGIDRTCSQLSSRSRFRSGTPKAGRGMTQSVSSAPPAAQEIYASLETLKSLINQTESAVVLDENTRDLILILGNTGAGRSTVAAFLTNDDDSAPKELESYHAGDRFLIRDRKGRISAGTSTLVSKSFYPIFTKDETSGTNSDLVWADLAGFENSRSESMELAQAFINHKIAQHAHRLKIVFVVNYSSLKTGESRIEFKNAVENAARFIKNADKFSPALSLVITKVQAPVTMTNTQIIQGIAKFIQNLRMHLPEVIGDEELRTNMENILDAFLSKEEDNSFSRIGLFHQPTEAGPLSQMATLKSAKTSLKKMINDLDFVEPSDDDFGVSLSSKAQYFVLKTERSLEDKILEILTQIGIKIQEAYSQKSADVPLAQLYGQLSIFRNLTGELENLELREGRVEFFQILGDILLKDLQMNDITEKLTELTKLGGNLDFLDQIRPIDPNSVLAVLPQVEWAEILRKSFNSVSDKIYLQAVKLNEDVESQVTQLENELLKLYRAKIQREETQPEQKSILSEDLSTDIQTLSTFLKENNIESTFNTFVNQTSDALTELRVGVHQRIIANFAKLVFSDENDVALLGGDPERLSAFRVDTWFRHFESVLQFLKTEHGRLEYVLKDEEYRDIEANLQTNVSSGQEELQRTVEKIRNDLEGVENAKLEAEEVALSKILFSQAQEIAAIERAEEEERLRTTSTTTTTTTTTTTPEPITVPTTTAEPFTTLYSPVVTNYGEWGEWEFCPSGTYAGGFQQKVQTKVDGDNTALNGIRLFCIHQRTNSIKKTLKSVEGPYGHWGQISYCGGPVVGFQLRSEKPQGNGDDTAANNVKIFCENGYTLIGGGMNWGDWTKERRCPNGEVVCGLKTQVVQDGDDDTGLNNMAVKCCSR